MKKWKERGKRIAVLLLTAALIGSSVDLSALTVNAAEDAAALKVNVELGGAQLLEATTITPQNRKMVMVQQKTRIRLPRRQNFTGSPDL